MIELFKEDEIRKSGLTAGQLREKFKDQLIRDFEMCGLDSYLLPLDDMSYDSIHHNLEQALEKIIKSGHSAYQQLLYRIDISEKQLSGALQRGDGKSESSVVADVIIKRILQKVIFKVIYSK